MSVAVGSILVSLVSLFLVLGVYYAAEEALKNRARRKARYEVTQTVENGRVIFGVAKVAKLLWWREVGNNEVAYPAKMHDPEFSIDSAIAKSAAEEKAMTLNSLKGY